MRHGDKINNLGRKSAHRRALLNNLTISLIEHKRITTTLAKAKALRVFAEPLITRSKTDDMHNRRVVFSYLQNKEAIKELFGTIGDKVANRPGGYLRIIKLPRRMGDAADMAMIEMVDFNEIYTKAGADTAKKTRRSRRGTGTATAKTAGSPAAENTEVADTDSSNDLSGAAETATADGVSDEVKAAAEAADVDIIAEATPVAEEAPISDETTMEGPATTLDNEAEAADGEPKTEA